jgi:hypothetical protein
VYVLLRDAPKEQKPVGDLINQPFGHRNAAFSGDVIKYLVQIALRLSREAIPRHYGLFLLGRGKTCAAAGLDIVGKHFSRLFIVLLVMAALYRGEAATNIPPELLYTLFVLAASTDEALRALPRSKSDRDPHPPSRR